MEMERAIDIAFGHGRWMCAGKRIAFMELSKVLFEVRNYLRDGILSGLQNMCGIR